MTSGGGLKEIHRARKDKARGVRVRGRKRSSSVKIPETQRLTRVKKIGNA